MDDLKFPFQGDASGNPRLHCTRSFAMPPIWGGQPWSWMRLLEFGNPGLWNVPRDVAFHRLGGVGDQHLRQHHAPLWGSSQLPRGHSQASQVRCARPAEACQVSPWSPTAGATSVLLLPRLDKPSEHCSTPCTSGLISNLIIILAAWWWLSHANTERTLWGPSCVQPSQYFWPCTNVVPCVA